MEFDITTIAISGFGLLIGIIYILIGNLSINAKKSVLRCLIILLIITLLNCLVEGRWDMDFVISFLILKKVGIWALRASVSLVYICILWGLVLELKGKVCKK
ncbi:MAG: hypothetical protein AB1552_14335 [Nitrospirota bacterium]